MDRPVSMAGPFNADVERACVHARITRPSRDDPRPGSESPARPERTGANDYGRGMRMALASAASPSRLNAPFLTFPKHTGADEDGGSARARVRARGAGIGASPGRALALPELLLPDGGLDSGRGGLLGYGGSPGSLLAGVFSVGLGGSGFGGEFGGGFGVGLCAAGQE